MWNSDTFLSEKGLLSPLNPRDVVFGGRTNAIHLHYTAEDGEQIYDYDFTSLYPIVNRTKEYPIGHLQIIYKDFGRISAYIGIAKLKKLSLARTFFPVLPAQVGGKLVFMLCRTCAEMKQQTICTYTDEERAIEGV